MRLLLAANNQHTRRNEIIKSYLKTGFKQQPICTPLAPTRNKIIYKTACSDGPILGPEKLLKIGFAQKGLPSTPQTDQGQPQPLHAFKLVIKEEVLPMKDQPEFPALQRRPAHAKPDFTWLSGPKNGTWKRTCGISCLRSLAPMWRFAMQHHPGNMHQSFATPRYSATPCYVLIQLPNVIDTISKRWRSKKAFNTSPCHIFS